jgi:hypothetical protein
MVDWLLTTGLAIIGLSVLLIWSRLEQRKK